MLSLIIWLYFRHASVQRSIYLQTILCWFFFVLINKLLFLFKSSYSSCIFPFNKNPVNAYSDFTHYLIRGESFVPWYIIVRSCRVAKFPAILYYHWLCFQHIFRECNYNLTFSMKNNIQWLIETRELYITRTHQKKDEPLKFFNLSSQLEDKFGSKEIPSEVCSALCFYWAEVSKAWKLIKRVLCYIVVIVNYSLILK